MSFTDWDVHTDGVITVSHDTGSSGPVGIGSLQITSSSGNPAVAHVVPSASSGFTTGVLDGRLRTIVQYNGSTGTGFGQSNYAGIVCMQSAANIAVAGSAYGLIWFFRDDMVIEDLRIVKWENGLNNATITTIAGPATFNKSSSDVWTMELDWVSSLSSTIGGTLLIARVGIATDFSDLSQVLTDIDLDSPLIVSSGEGFLHRYRSSTTAFVRTVRFDNSSLFTLT